MLFCSLSLSSPLWLSELLVNPRSWFPDANPKAIQTGCQTLLSFKGLSSREEPRLGTPAWHAHGRRLMQMCLCGDTLVHAKAFVPSCAVMTQTLAVYF